MRERIVYEYDDYIENIENYNIKTAVNANLTKEERRKLNYARFLVRTKKQQVNDFYNRQLNKYAHFIPPTFIVEYIHNKALYDTIIDMKPIIDIELATHILTTQTDKIEEEYDDNASVTTTTSVNSVF